MLEEIVFLLVRTDIRKRQTEFGIVILTEILDMVARRLLGNMAGKRLLRDIKRRLAAEGFQRLYDPDRIACCGAENGRAVSGR